MAAAAAALLPLEGGGRGGKTGNREREKVIFSVNTGRLFLEKGEMEGDKGGENRFL